MEVQEDFRDLLALFNAHNVDYVIVGAYALALHGAPRYTGDMDIFVKADRGNAQRILAALEEFGFGSVGLTPEDFAIPENIIQLGVPPVRVDIVTSLTGVSWDDVASGREKALYGDVSICYIGKKEFIRNKRALGRKKDLADIEALGED
jgi:hypothetical protein